MAIKLTDMENKQIAKIRMSVIIRKMQEMQENEEACRR